ncbi:uncharacterized protein LOC107024437 isoform X1 [Solanum pennellii]|uniref:Uncharacterized protein LOC107024437 isoform X1 n=1 Tax=Solanum pennellii TaxID=28526 RepID=A0ABM1VF79_SOLPN|nr:uncharacterized protein LOC107024437 isoform X1 [Solanum pennellii]XP_027774398.1 uncharacterized protein LOC107024437 isoform X1 [Solanum pennellii]
MRVISEKSSKHSMIKSCMLKSPRICIFWVFFFVICTFLQLQWTNYKLVIKLSSLLKKEDIPYLMDSGDKSWMSFRRSTNEYISGVNNFLYTTFELASRGYYILCPCKKCANCKWHQQNVVQEHLVVFGFVQGYTKWIFHGESISLRNIPGHNKEGSNMRDNIDGLLYDTFRDVAGDLGLEGVREGLSEDAKKFYKLLE